LRVDWDYLEIKETWPNMTKDIMQQMYNEIQPYRDPYTGEYNKWLGISNLAFKKKTILTVDLIGKEYKITNKQLYEKAVGEAWRWIKYGLSQLNDPNKPTSEDKIEGIREFSPDKPYSAVTKIGTYEQIKFNADKLTFIISSDFGFIISLKIGLGNPQGTTYTPGLQGVASEYEILKASMYGCARRGNTWKGIRLNYKYN